MVLVRLATITSLALSFTAHALDCRLSKSFTYRSKTYGPCEITGDAGSGSKKTFQLHCEGMSASEHLELEANSEHAKLLDSSTRYETAKCPTEKAALAEMIKAYQTRVKELENPPCYLTQWKGQMTFFAHGTKGRCTFDMNKEQADEFTKKMALSPFYQCEKGYFLVIPKSGAAEVFKPKGGKWESVCKAPTKVGEPVEAIDWKNPPNYYHP